MSIGRSACRNAPIATSTAMCAARRSTKRAISRRSRPKSPIGRRSRRAGRCARCSSAAARPRSCALRRCRASSTRSPPPGGSINEAEITLEANPTSVEAERFRGYRSAGVNRLSIGVQALNDADLKALGRKHTVVEALAAVELAASLFPRFSFDLIYGRPGQGEAGLAPRARRGARTMSATTSRSTN